MTFSGKLERLQRRDEFVLCRWMALSSRVAGSYYKLSDVRLQIMKFGGGQDTRLIEAVPILTSEGSSIIVTDHDAYQIKEGLLAGYILRKGDKKLENAKVRTPNQFGNIAVSCNSSQHVRAAVRSLAITPYTPVLHIPMPLTCRLARDASTIRLLQRYSDSDAAALSVDVSGHIAVPLEITRGGGTVVVDHTMVSRYTPSAVFGMTYNMFRADAARLGFEIDFGKE